MAENLVVNDVTYPDVDVVSMTNEAGEQVAFYPDAVRYKEQALTDDEKEQARANIGAQEKLTGQAGKFVAFDESGNLVPVDAPKGGGMTEEELRAAIEQYCEEVILNEEW